MTTKKQNRTRVLAGSLGVLGVVGTVVEASFEQLNGDDGEDELKEHVDDHDVENVLERVDDAVEHRLTTGHTHRRNVTDNN